MDIQVDNINDSFLSLINDIPYWKPTNPRKFNCEEHSGLASIIIDNPVARVLTLNYRKNNPFATMFETFWVFSGRNDIKSLSLYLPRAGNFSDDGKVWRAGYGPRLRNPCEAKVPGHVDQIRYVYDCLKEDPDSRRAVIGIWHMCKDPAVHYNGGSKDFPCNDIVQFMIRDGKLNCFTYVRSNDVLWGYSGVNVFEWTFLQSLLAYCLGVGVGYYHHITPSIHCYTDYADRLKDIKNGNRYGSIYNWLKPTDHWRGSKDIYIKLKIIEEICAFGAGEQDDFEMETAVRTNSAILEDAIEMFKAWYWYKKNKFSNAIDCCLELRKFDLKVACLHYLFRQNRKWYKENVDAMFLQEQVMEKYTHDVTNVVAMTNYLKDFFDRP